MANSYVTYSGDGSTTQFNLAFPWMDKSHVFAAVDGENVNYTWINNSRINISPAPASGASVRVYRETPTTALTVYSAGSVIKSDALNNALRQPLLLAEEERDRIGDLTTTAAGMLAQAQVAAAQAIAASAAVGSVIAPPFKVVRTAALTNINASSAPASVSGVALAVGDRVLLAGQTAGAENGISVFNGAGLGMTRATDADNALKMPSGTTVMARQGTYGNSTGATSFILSTAPGFVVGTNALTFDKLAPSSIKTGGVYVTEKLGSANPNIVRGDAFIEIRDDSGTGHAMLSQIIGDPTDEVANNRGAFDSGGATVQLMGDFNRFVGGVNTAGAWRGVKSFHLPSGNGDDIVPECSWSNGSRASGCGPIGASPWASMPTNTWYDFRTGHAGVMVRNAFVVGNGHTFATNSASGFNAEISGGLQVGDIDGSGVTDHAVQFFYSVGAASALVQAYRNSTASLIPLTLSANRFTFSGGGVVLDLTKISNAANDAAAASAGVVVGAIYRNGSALMVRVS